MLRQRLAGLVLTVADADRSAVLPTLAAAHMPFVLAHNVPQDAAWQGVCVDNRRAMAEATAHLLALGHRHIGMVAGPVLQSDRAQQRFLGYCDAMQQAGLKPAPLIEMPSHTRSDFNLLPPRLRRASPLTAVICNNNLLAISLMGAAARAGVQVPTQLSVMGFDGIETGEHLSPSLASVVQPGDLLGACAIDMLLQRSSGGLRMLAHHLRLGESIAFASAALLAACGMASPFAHEAETAICSVADVVYYGVSFGIQTAGTGVTTAYNKPAHRDDIPAGMKDPDGKWVALHSGTMGFTVNVDELGGAPVPKAWDDLLKPKYKGIVGYLDPASAFVGYVAAVAVNQAKGSSM
ncbi:Purine nucleotide synthesis repressor|nr:Purine nucleotide synthesis repressor [Candidatus Pantoea persica]